MGAHKDLEQIKLVALHYAKEHKCNYNVILLNPNEDGEFDALASTYEYVADSYFDKPRDNAIILFKTDEEVIDPVESERKLPMFRTSDFVHPFYNFAYNAPTMYDIGARPAKLRGKPIKDNAPSKFGRNLPCDCGSGKKFKKCCLYSAKTQ